MNITKNLVILGLAAATSFTTTAPSFAQDNMGKDNMKMESKMDMKMMSLGKTGTFSGIEVKKGSVELFKAGKAFHLKVSSDFSIPASPAPHWQVIDKDGNVYLLNQFKIAGDKLNREIVLPSYIKSVAKVQVWCSFAEVNLGEAKFAKPMMLK